MSAPAAVATLAEEHHDRALAPRDANDGEQQQEMHQSCSSDSTCAAGDNLNSSDSDESSPVTKALPRQTKTNENSEGGRCGYFGGQGNVVFAGFLTNVGTYGVTATLGLFVPAWTEYFGVSTSFAASLVSTLQAMQFFGTLVSGILIPRWVSHRNMAFASSVLALGGYLLSAFCQDVTAMRFALGLAVGGCLGTHTLAGITSVQMQVPKDKQAFSMGIATCGATFGCMVLPSIVAAIMDRFGWRTAWICLGSCTTLVMCGASSQYAGAAEIEASKRRHGQQQQQQQEKLQQQQHQHQQRESGEAITAPARVPLFRDPLFVIWWLNSLLCLIGFFAPLTLMAYFLGATMNAAPQVSANVYIIIGATGLPMRIGQGWISKKLGSARLMLWFSQFFAGVMVACLGFCSSEIGAYIWAAFYGIAQGPYLALSTVVILDLFGLDLLPIVAGLTYTAVGLGVLMGPPFVAYMSSLLGYKLGFFIGGAFMMGSSVSLLLVPWVQRLSRSLAEDSSKRGTYIKGDDSV